MSEDSRNLRRIPVRMSPQLHGQIEASALSGGCSLAQYMREAALMRLAWELGVAYSDAYHQQVPLRARLEKPAD